MISAITYHWKQLVHRVVKGNRLLAASYVEGMPFKESCLRPHFVTSET